MEYGISERWHHLCKEIALEQDAKKFAKLFDEVCLLLEQREAELMAKQKSQLTPDSKTDVIASRRKNSDA